MATRDFMVRPSVTIIGIEALEAKLKEARTQAPRLLAMALHEEANLIMTEAKRRTPVGGGPYSPRDPHPGTLRASGTVMSPTYSRGRASVTLGFGGAARAYARVQHDRQDFRHHVGRSLFLESAVLDAAPRMGQRLADRIARRLL